MKTPTETTQNATRSGKAGPIIALVFAILGFLLLRRADREFERAGGIRVPTPGVISEPLSETTRSPRPEEVTRYKKEVEDVLADYDREVACAAADFRDSFTEGQAEFAAVRSRLPGIAAQYRRFGKVKSVVVAVATDKLRKTNRLEELVAADFMAPVFSPAMEAAGKMDGAYAILRSSLEESRQTAMRRLGVAARKLPGASIAPDLNKSLNERTEKVVNGVQSAISAVADGGVAIGVAGGIELACIASTVRSIAAICSGVAAKATASAAAPAADGPLPIFDILAVGGLVWTACDIHKLTRTMPRQLQTALEQSVNGMEADAMASIKEPAKHVINLYKAESAEMRRAAYAPIKDANPRK